MVGSVGRARAGLPPAREVTLRDGTPILVRPILPQDKQRLRDGFARLSEASRCRRFMTPLEHLSDAQLRYFTKIDYVDHMAWVALDPDQPAQPGLGVARYIRLPDDPTTAEAAVAVVDERQGREIGTILLEVLAASARQHGIQRFRAWVLAENAPMVELLRDLGATVVRDGVAAAGGRADSRKPTGVAGHPDGPGVQGGGQRAPAVSAARSRNRRSGGQHSSGLSGHDRPRRPMNHGERVARTAATGWYQTGWTCDGNARPQGQVSASQPARRQSDA